MNIIIAPARKFKNPETPPQSNQELLFSEETAFLLANIQNLSPWDLQNILKTSEALAQEAFIRYQEMDLSMPGNPALYAYEGLVYRNIQAENLTIDTLDFAQHHLYIISAFYGLLKPMDPILPYRLEMRSALQIHQKNLYDFWSNKIYEHLYQKKEPLINLAAEEYTKTIRKYLKPSDMFIDICFYDFHKGKLRTITTQAKIARGKMVRYILKNKIDDPEKLKYFTQCGYKYEKSLSSPYKMVFINN